MSKKQPDIPKTFHVIARTPGRVMFDGQCTMVMGENAVGPFTILPGHQNFITNISREVVLHKEDKTHESIPVQVGVLHVKGLEVTVYIIMMPAE